MKKILQVLKTKTATMFVATALVAGMLVGAVPAAAATVPAKEQVTAQYKVVNGSDLQLAMALKGNKKQWKKYKKNIKKMSNSNRICTVKKKKKGRKAVVDFNTTYTVVIPPENLDQAKSQLSGEMNPKMTLLKSEMKKIKKYAKLKRLTIRYTFKDQAGTVIYKRTLKK